MTGPASHKRGPVTQISPVWLRGGEWDEGTSRAHSPAGMAVRVRRADGDLQPPPPPSKSTPANLRTLKIVAGIELTLTVSAAVLGMFAGVAVSAEFGVWGLMMQLTSPEVQ